MTEHKDLVLLMLTDNWNDWEPSYAAAVIHSFSDYTVSTIAVDKAPKQSMGGLSTEVTYGIADFAEWDRLALVILPGGLSWEQHRYEEIADFIRQTTKARIPVAAICGATLFLCRHGFLNQIRHTGDSLEQFLEQPEYTGKDLYQNAQVVFDGNIITANETAAVEFAYRIFKLLEIDSEEELDLWYRNFRYGAVSQ